jgi:hypothetical protein
MKMHKIPNNFKKEDYGKDLRVTSYIGRDGYKESQVLRAGQWRPNDVVYVHDETTSVVFRALDSQKG